MRLGTFTIERMPDREWAAAGSAAEWLIRTLVHYDTRPGEFGRCGVFR